MLLLTLGKKGQMAHVGGTCKRRIEKENGMKEIKSKNFSSSL
jgi:hypothetical protein